MGEKLRIKIERTEGVVEFVFDNEIGIVEALETLLHQLCSGVSSNPSVEPQR